ncbi:nineteen complex-related protein 2-domain-containing protein [Amylostereum chailletii]|nr:nineteen complex-related protein 2-domain-containing protein [Amylostereum chailletii]
MTDSPIVFKRTKNKVTQRVRDSPIVDSNVGLEPEGSNPAALASKIKSKAKQRNKPKTNLSFGGDDEEGGEVFKVKKSSLSKKLTLGTHPASPGNLPSDLDQANISAHTDRGPVYDQAYLSELKASTPSSRPRPPPDDTHDGDVAMDTSGMGDTTIETVNVFGNDDPVILSQSSILAAKEKRERLRMSASKGEDDYISLSVTKHGEGYQGPHPESRLVREEDELGEGDDEFAEYTSAQERIALGRKSRKKEASQRRNNMKELIADAEEVDEETQEWEQEQIRRGGMAADDDTPMAAKPVYHAAPIPPVTAIPTLEPAVARLASAMTTLTASHTHNTTSMASLAAEQAQLDKREAKLREIVAKAEEKRRWFASFREWVETVATFLDEKYPRLETLEKEHYSLLTEHRDMIYQRRRADDSDDLAVFLGAPPIVPHTEPEELDELGRVIPLLNPTAARRDRQAARVSRRSKRSQGVTRRRDTEDGYSTDSSLPPSEATDYRAALARLAEKREDVLSDVKAEEFRDPSLGLGRWFGEWRESFKDIYTGAWGGLGLVGAWEFWVRLEMLGWSPFEDLRSLDTFKWYTALHQYSRPQQTGDEGDNEPDLGPEGDLTSAMTSTTVIPLIARIVEEGGFDPWSGKDIRRLVDLAEELETLVERNNLKFQTLSKAVVTAFQAASRDSITLQKPYLALNMPQFNPESIPARRRLLMRHRKLLSNLLQWRRHSGALYGIDEIIANHVKECLLPIANSGWEVGGEDHMREVSVFLCLHWHP